MFADKGLRCDCGYEVRGHDEEALVVGVRSHAADVHGIDLTPEVALDLVRRAAVVPRGERNETGEET